MPEPPPPVEDEAVPDRRPRPTRPEGRPGRRRGERRRSSVAGRWTPSAAMRSDQATTFASSPAHSAARPHQEPRKVDSSGTSPTRSSQRRSASPSRPSAKSIQPRVSPGAPRNPGWLSVAASSSILTSNSVVGLAAPGQEDRRRVQDRGFVGRLEVIGEQVGPHRQRALRIDVVQGHEPPERLEGVDHGVPIADAAGQLQQLAVLLPARRGLDLEGLDDGPVAERPQERRRVSVGPRDVRADPEHPDSLADAAQPVERRSLGHQRVREQLRQVARARRSRGRAPAPRSPAGRLPEEPVPARELRAERGDPRIGGRGRRTPRPPAPAGPTPPPSCAR